MEDYQRVGKEVGYWAHRFREALRRNGGLATAKRMLRPTNAQYKGLTVLLEAGRPDLTVENTILSERFRTLFTDQELHLAESRLLEYKRKSAELKITRERLYPDGIRTWKELL